MAGLPIWIFWVARVTPCSGKVIWDNYVVAPILDDLLSRGVTIGQAFETIPCNTVFNLLSSIGKYTATSAPD